MLWFARPMKSPNEVAAAKAEFFDDFQVRVGRFAGGADLSKRYARELHDWLAARHRSDELAERVVAVLQDYPGSARVPAWWKNSPVLDAVPTRVLEHSPEYLERAIQLAGDDGGDTTA
jgi:hypothetical protein